LTVVYDDQLTSNCNPESHLTGHAKGEALLKRVGKIVFKLSICVGQGYNDSAASLGAASRCFADAKKVQYFRSVMHRLNLCATQAVKTPETQHAQNVIKDTVSFSKYSAKPTELFKSCIVEVDDGRISKLQ